MLVLLAVGYTFEVTRSRAKELMLENMTGKTRWVWEYPGGVLALAWTGGRVRQVTSINVHSERKWVSWTGMCPSRILEASLYFRFS